MKWTDRITVGCKILEARLLRKKIPIVIRWQLTYRCPLRCRYCRLWDRDTPELETDKILALLDEITTCGTKKISFSGGEPMLREDIGTIIDYCASKGISAEMNSTGFLIPQKIKMIKGLDLLKLSLDGPEDIHDLVRGKEGSFKWVIDAAEAAARNKVKFIFTTTLTKYNINHLNDLWNFAKRFKTLVAFQPLKGFNPNAGQGELESLYPTEEEFKKAIDKLMAIKKKDKGIMRNSLYGLRHIYHWPRYEKLTCRAGQIFCMIDPKGDLAPCDRLRYAAPLPNCMDLGFKRAFMRLPQIHCNGCGFCGSLELNYLASFKWGILSTLSRIYK